LAVIGVIVAAIGPPLVSQISEFGEAIPSLLDEFRSSLPGSLAGSLGTGDLGSTLSEGLVSLGSSMSTAFGFMVKLTFIGVLGPYLAVSLPAIVRAGTRLLPRERREDFLRSVNASTTLVGNYILGNLAVSILAGIVAFAGLSLLGVPFALALAVWVAVVDAIPAIGATLGAIPALFVAATAGFGTLVGTLVFFVVYQQMENHLVIPVVMRRAVSISPAAVLIAILLGGAVAGVFGVILAVPIAALLKVLVFDRLVHERIISLNGEPGGPLKPARWRPGSRPGSRPLP
jgi:predicted PurR-regulated permease PerM